MSAREFQVACLCAEWCDTCREYRPGFLALAGRFPQADFVWLDVEADAKEAGYVEIDNFPTIRVKRGATVLFEGVMTPHHEHLARMLEKILRP